LTIDCRFHAHIPVNESARLVWHSFLNQEGSGQSGAGNNKAVDTECPGETQAVDDGIECDTNDSATCTASSENDAVGQTTSAKEVLCGSHSDSLKIVSNVEVFHHQGLQHTVKVNPIPSPIRIP
jgi:hypothetical protein